MIEASAALICAAVPLTVTVAVPLLVIVAPPPVTTESVPAADGIESVVVSDPPSTSATETPVMIRLVSSFVVCAPGTVFTGASFTGVIESVRVEVSVPPNPSETV